MTDPDTTPVWKKLYHVISGGNSSVTADITDDILNICKPKLISGLLEFPAYSKESFQSWKDNPGLKDFVTDDEMCNFIHLLSKELDLDVNVAWTIICNFLMFEYFGKVDELKSIIRYDTNVKCLIDNIWYFYSGDRMFMLKTLRHIFENVSDKDHIFYEQFSNFMKTIDTKLLWKNLVRMFDNLINEIDRDKSLVVSHETMVRWIHRNNREQVEVVMLLIHTMQYCKIDGKELEDILVLFIRHGFTRHPLYQESTGISKPKDVLEVKTAEIGCVLTIMEKYWQSPDICNVLPRNTEKNLELLQIQGDNSIVLFAWSVLKTSIVKSDEAMDYCNTITCELISKKVFKSLHELLLNPIFGNCKTGDIVVEAVFKLMVEFIKICADFGYLHEQIGVCSVTAELLKRKGLVVLDYLGPIFQLSMDAFPFIFMPFLEMCKSLFTIPGHYDIIMDLLRNIPGFLAEIPWNDHREKFNLVGTQQLFIDSELFIIPEGTPVERFRYHDMEFARFIYPFSFFLLMEQFTKSLSVITFEVGRSWYCYDNLTELVQIGFQFINHILKQYQGDFRSDTVLRTLVQRLEIVPTQFCEGPTKNFNFIRLYFETNITLITHDLLDFMEVFPPHLRKKIFPRVSNYDKIDQQLIYTQMRNESLLFRSLKEEETMNDHSLLVQYLKLLDYMIDNNLYHQEIQAAGVWYLLNVAFPLHQQWPYNDELQSTIICKYCISIFVKVLQNQDMENRDYSDEIFNMCVTAFINEEVLIRSYISVFYKDKFFVQNLMEEETNWIKGPLLLHLETIRIQMVLLLLLYKMRSSFPPTIKCAMDDKMSTVAKAMSAYIINPYSTPLRILSCKFLEVLARDENVPLMALLGLDYDQVQRLFLDKLRDPMEDDNVKIHILELVGVCIFCQHGMTAAFFNVTRSRKWYSDNKEKTIEGDSVTDFMIDYLQNIRKSHSYLKSPLQIGILRVMANLWIGGKQHLIKDIVALDAFWPLLADPLFQEYTQSSSVYAYILKIFSIQLTEPSITNKFKLTLEKFLTNEKQLPLWQKYILEILESGADNYIEIEDKEFLIKSWMEFVLMTEKDSSLKKFKDDKIKILFIEMCLDGIKSVLANLHCLDTWVNLSLIQISYWGLHFKDKDQSMARKLITMYGIIDLHYNALGIDLRSTVLNIAHIALKELRDYFENNTKDLLEFLETLGPLIDYEHMYLEEEVWKLIKCRVPARELTIPWMMCINIANSLLTFKNVEDCSVWFTFRNYLSKMIKCTGDLVNEPETLTLAKLAIRSLALYVESPLALDFLNINMTKFFDSIEPPITTLLLGKGNKVHPMQLEDGWIMCTLIMKFIQAFLNKFQYTALPTCYTYMTLHAQTLQHIISIPESTVALRALELLITTLMFFDSILVHWQTEWYRKSNDTYTFVLNGVKKIINSSLYAILRPKNIVIYTVDNFDRLNQLDKVPLVLMVGIMNKLVTAAGLGFSILYRVNPSLIDLMDIHIPDTMTVLILNDFSVPKFELPIPYDLTYGKLLCLAHFMCKTLDALHLGNMEAVDQLPHHYYSKWMGLVEHQDSADNLPNQKLSAFLRYAMYEYSGLADPWIQKLNYHRVKKSLDLLMTFLGQQVYLYVKTADPENTPYYKRNLASELQFFYEHIKRHTSLLLHRQSFMSSQLESTYKIELDVIKRYLLYCRENDKSDDIVENNFCLVISHWFTNICQIY